MQYSNPIVSGFNPDPSVCRVGKDFYLVLHVSWNFIYNPVEQLVSLSNSRKRCDSNEVYI